MDAELEEWKAAGHYFDYLGFDIFYRVEGSGAAAATHSRIPVQLVGLGAHLAHAGGAVHRYRAGHDRHGFL
ncbi:alpha/beta hydrolase domain protein [Mycobacteroides abscessus 1948]|uniref:Alpha/beta hydrolase domain protein n=1 Tax=Mycobacteroides abscessus 1948 TaxID=1299323 RepID=A0A829QJ02_9MYCO|nr:alpha/beta hydrolase domain protein [Mycobacteroides abscessus 1948]